MRTKLTNVILSLLLLSGLTLIYKVCQDNFFSKNLNEKTTYPNKKTTYTVHSQASLIATWPDHVYLFGSSDYIFSGRVVRILPGAWNNDSGKEPDNPQNAIETPAGNTVRLSLMPC